MTSAFRLALLSLLLLWHTAAVAEPTYHLAESDVIGESSDWGDLDERQVHFRTLRHEGGGVGWTIKIGKAGQIYSIRVEGLGELISKQRPQVGQWVDEVFQHTLPMPPQKTRDNIVVDGDIHQSGYYVMSDLDKKILLPRSVYSPMFAYRFDTASNSASALIWPQHAHLPRTYAENLMLMKQTISDLGDGVVELEIQIDKWGGARNEMFGLPWAAFRRDTVPVQIISTASGGYSEASGNFNRSTPRRLSAGDTGGWLAFVDKNDPSGKGIGIVFGKGLNRLEQKGSFVRWGNFRGPGKSDVDGILATVKRDINLAAGESLRYRYYIVLGSLQQIQTKANEYESKVLLSRETLSRDKSGPLGVCVGKPAPLKRGCEEGEKPYFYAYKDFFSGARPLFLLKSARRGEYRVTDDPYEISFDPTDGATEYVDFLGWAAPNGDKVSCEIGQLTTLIDQVRDKPEVGKNADRLNVMKVDRSDCADKKTGADPSPNR